MSGKIIDGYISGATVFWDCNGNGVLDSGELSTLSGAGGDYTLAGKPAAGCSLLAWVGPGSIDADRPLERGTWYTMSAIDGQESLITPLTTLVAGRVRSGGISVAAAQVEVAAGLGLQAELNIDYVAARSTGLIAAAAEIARSLQKQDASLPISDSAMRAWAELQQRYANSATREALARGITPFIASFRSIGDQLAQVVTGNDALRLVRRIDMPSAADNATLDDMAAQVNAGRQARFGQANWASFSTEELSGFVRSLNRTNANAGTSATGVALSELQRARAALFAQASSELNREIGYDGAWAGAIDFFAADPLASLDYALQSISISVDIAKDITTLATPRPRVGRPTNYALSMKKLMAQLEIYSYLVSAADCSAKVATLEKADDVSAGIVNAVAACGTFLADNAKDITGALKTSRATPAFTAALTAAGGAFGAATEEDRLLAQAKTAATTASLIHGLFGQFLADPVTSKIVAAGDLVLQFLNARIAAMELERAATAKLDDAVRAAMARYNDEIAKVWRAYYISYMEMIGNYYFRVADGGLCPTGQSLDAMGNCVSPTPPEIHMTKEKPLWGNDNWTSDILPVCGVNWYRPSDGGTGKTLFQFDHANVPSAANRVFLNLYTRTWDNRGPASAEIYRVSQAWDPTSVFWQSIPSIEATPVATFELPAYAPEGWVKVEITSLVRAWQGGAVNYGILIDGKINPWSYCRSFYSSASAGKEPHVSWE